MEKSVVVGLCLLFGMACTIIPANASNSFNSASLRDQKYIMKTENYIPSATIGVAGRHIYMTNRTVYAHSSSKLKNKKHRARVAAYNETSYMRSMLMY